MQVRTLPSVAVSLALVAIGLFGAGLSPFPAAAVSISLYGSAAGGWGSTPTTISSPGPPITVQQFDTITVRLEGVDAPRHNFYVDYNADGNPDPPTEPISPDFRSSTGPITYTFTANVAGVFTYYCEYHQSTMFGTFVVQAPGAAPVAAVSMPDGAQDWTGGSVHRVWWNMSDADDANAALTVYLNYSSVASSGSIVGPRAGTANPNFVDWTVPLVDANDVTVNLTVIDPSGLKAWDDASVPVVDSTPPTVAATAPAPGATNVPRTATVQLVWSEPMNSAATGSAASFGLRIAPAGAWVAGTFSWNRPQDTAMTFIPATQLQPSTAYEAIVNTSAKDDSQPGNAIAAVYTWTFATGTAADTQPPQIAGVTASPSWQNVGGAVNVSAVVTDNFGVASVWLKVIPPSGVPTNASMFPALASVYYLNRTYAEIGVHAFILGAFDTSGLWTSASGQFEIGDAEPPIIVHTPPASLGLGQPLNVTASVTDGGTVAEVRLNWTDTSSRMTNATMSSQGSTYWIEIPMQLREGTLAYFVWAVDGAGNEVRTPLATVPVRAPVGALVLYGHTTRGWGLGPDNLTSPGPTIRVSVGTTVSLLLIPVDGIRHNFFVDYNGDGGPDADGPLSPDFEDRAITLQFVASRVGSFTYYCEYHAGTMRATFLVEGAALPGGDLAALWITVSIAFVVVAVVAAILVLRRRKPKQPGA